MNRRFDKVETKIENDVETKISSLFDGYKQVSENVIEIKEKMINIEDKIGNQEVEIRVLKSVK